MKVRSSPRLRAYVTAGLVGLAAGLAAGAITPVLVGTAFLVLAVVGLVGGEAAQLEISILEWPESMVEGEEKKVLLRLTSEQNVGRTYIDLRLTRGLSVVSADGARVFGEGTLMVSRVGRQCDVAIIVVASAWGRHGVGPVRTFTEAPLGMFEVANSSTQVVSWVAVPEDVTLQHLMSPLETNLHVGELVSRLRGPGSEFADLRSYRPGDDPRNINWRVTSRSDGLWVNERHPERNGDVILLVDAQLESNTDLRFVVDKAVRLAAALLQGHGRRRHRLGLITLDGMCRWIGAGAGEVHRRRLVAQLLGVTPGQVIWDAVERAVVRAAKQPAMVIALSPLLDPNMAGLLNVLRRSGVDVAVIEIDVAEELEEPDREDRRVGRRIWALERERIRDRLSGVGVPVAIWREPESPESALVQLQNWRMAWRRQLG